MTYRSRIRTDNSALESEVCRRDIEHWINKHVWTYDPRLSPSTIPFDLFPIQVDFLKWLQEREDASEGGIVEKSRDMGVTWLACAYAVHGWLYRDGFACGFGSRKLELVDTLDDLDSILEKCRFILDNLPKWMLPKGFSRRNHANHCKIFNPENGSTITGEGGDNIGRGGRQSIYFVDESAFLEHPARIESSLSATTECRIDVSTPNGPGNPFAQRRFSGALPVFTLHYRDDPRKTPEWIAKKKKELSNPVIWASEWEIDYTASIEGICIPAEWVRAAVNLLPNEEYAHGPIVAGLDISEFGDDETVFQIRQGPCVLGVTRWQGANTTETAWRSRDLAMAHSVSEVRYDVGGVGAGVRGTWDTSERPLTFHSIPVNAGETPTENRWPDGQTSVQKFRNLRAEMAWMLRQRFEKSFEYRNGVKHLPDEMISIPNDQQLIAELSMPLVERTETGKIQLESKANMKKRGIKSPNRFDALALAFLVPMKRRTMQWWTA